MSFFHNSRNNNQKNNYNNNQNNNNIQNNNKKQQESKFVIKNENFPELPQKSSLNSSLKAVTIPLKAEESPLLSVTKVVTTTTEQINQLLTAMDITKPLSKHPINPKDERTQTIDAIMRNWDRYRDQFESIYGEGVYDEIYSSSPIYFEEPEQGTHDDSQEYDDAQGTDEEEDA